MPKVRNEGTRTLFETCPDERRVQNRVNIVLGIKERLAYGVSLLKKANSKESAAVVQTARTCQVASRKHVIIHTSHSKGVAIYRT